MVRAQHPAVVAACDRYNKLPSSNFIFQIKNRLQGTDRRYTNCVTQYSADTYLVVDMWSDCFTVPPQSMDHFRSQRKRWTSNAITGNWFLMFGSNVPVYTRILCGIDLFRIHTSVTRFCCTVQFFLALGREGAELTAVQLSMLGVVLALPYLFFLSTIVTRGRYGAYLFVGSLLSKLCSPFITVYIFLYAMQNFADLTWGKTHGSQPTGGASTEKEKEEDDLELGIVFADKSTSPVAPPTAVSYFKDVFDATHAPLELTTPFASPASVEYFNNDDDVAPLLIEVDEAELDEVDLDYEAGDGEDSAFVGYDCSYNFYDLSLPSIT
jgi:hypothetical protein